VACRIRFNSRSLIGTIVRRGLSRAVAIGVISGVNRRRLSRAPPSPDPSAASGRSSYPLVPESSSSSTVCIPAPASASAIVPHDTNRELVITVPLPDDTGRRGDGRPKLHRFRSHWLELGRRLRAFRAQYGVTQAKVARAPGRRRSLGGGPVGARHRRARGRAAGAAGRAAGRAPLARTAGAIVSYDLPESWERGTRWYRRVSREQRARETAGVVVGTLLDERRAVASSRPCARHTAGATATGSAAWPTGAGWARRTGPICAGSKMPPTACAAWSPPMMFASPAPLARAAAPAVAARRGSRWGQRIEAGDGQLGDGRPPRCLRDVAPRHDQMPRPTSPACSARGGRDGPACGAGRPLGRRTPGALDPNVISQ
jgi:hypothetical protein